MMESEGQDPVQDTQSGAVPPTGEEQQREQERQDALTQQPVQPVDAEQPNVDPAGSGAIPPDGATFGGELPDGDEGSTGSEGEAGDDADENGGEGEEPAGAGAE